MQRENRNQCNQRIEVECNFENTMVSLPYPEIDQRTGKVKMMRCPEECGKQQRLKQGKPEWQKQREEEKKRRKEMRRKGAGERRKEEKAKK